MSTSEWYRIPAEWGEHVDQVLRLDFDASQAGSASAYWTKWMLLSMTNVRRFAKLIGDLAATTQLVVITHSRRTMQEADVIYGVTMQEPGVSKIVSMKLSRDTRSRDAQARRAVA